MLPLFLAAIVIGIVFLAINRSTSNKSTTATDTQSTTVFSKKTEGAEAFKPRVETNAEKAPDMCPTVYDPVCGDDGKTYSNACFAAKAGQNSTAPGSCTKSEIATAGSGESDSYEKTSMETPENGTVESPAGSGENVAALSGTASLTYWNESLGYGFSLPRNSYFAGFWARDGATHSVGIARTASPETFELSETRVKYYRNKILPEVKDSENGFFSDVENGKTYLALSGSTILVEADLNLSGDIVKSIAQSAYVR